MNFHSAEFGVLLSSVVLLYFGLPLRFRNPLLLVASAVFYMWWRPEYILLILFSVAIDYAVARRLGVETLPRRRRLLLWVSLVSNLGLLFFFKYFGFAADSLRVLCDLAGRPFLPPAFEVVLPVGISFYTFQALSYTIDVYRGDLPPERRFPRLCLYVLFFPQLVAGPIERSKSLLPQFDETHRFDPLQASSGLRLVLWGLVKKVAVADRLALIVDPVYNGAGSFSGPVLLLATYAFAFQIYADFSAYSDIAVGSARILGFRLMQNFDRPYFAVSPADFWRRWHVSLSTWFRDYVYVPLGGNRLGPVRWAAAVLATFLLSGLWHGARWTFVVWGAYHGLLVLLAQAAGRLRLPALPAALRMLLTFHLVLVGWVFFRAPSLGDVAHIFRHAWTLSGSPLAQLGLSTSDLVVAALGAAALVAVDAWRSAWSFLWPVPLRWLAYAVGALLVLNGRLPAANPFIYFRF